jgi:hypothetical protein
VRLHDFRLLSDCIENLSEGGALAGSSAAASPGEKLLVSFRIPNTDAWVDVDAVVARVLHGRRAGDRGSRLGLQFEGVSVSRRQLLHKAMSHAPPVVPQVRPGRRDVSDAVRTMAIGSGWSHSRLGQMLVRWWEK